MKSLIQALTLFSVIALFTACYPSQVATTSNPMYEPDLLYDNSWDLIELNGNVIDPMSDTYSYITFTPSTNSISGYTSCNAIGGTLSLSDRNGLTLTPRVTTNNTCVGNRIDATLVPALRNVNTWAVVDDHLVMYDDGQIVARWAPSEFTDDDLYGNWKLSYVSDNTLPFDVMYPKDKIPTLVFTDGNNVVTGTTGYNTISCPITITGSGIAFSDCESTKVACEGPGESIFMNNLKSINHYRFTDDNTLVLVTDDNEVMRFTRM